jgi:hypothetical protein
MQKAIAKEGLRAPLFCLGATLLVAASGMAAAQTVAQSDLALCASLETTELKLACFEALTASEGKGASSAAGPPPESAATETAIITAGAAAGVAESDAGRVAPAAADNDQADDPDDLGLEQPAEVHAEAVDELSREYPTEEQVSPDDEMGREHLDEEKLDEKEEAVVRVTVSEVVKGSHDVLYFHFANGQVWRQIESRRFSYPRNGEFDVIIDSGMMGDYRLRLDRGGPMTPIRRVK